MKLLQPSTPQRPAFTLVEMLCTLAVIAILAALLLPVLQRGHGRAKRAVCSNNLKQVGVAMSAWAHEHNDLFPMQVRTNQQGTLEIARAVVLSRDVSETFRHFQALSNEMVTPKVLVCPAERRRVPAVNFPALRNENVSYWINPGAVLGRVDSPLAGDRNVRTSGRMEWTFIQFGAGDNVEFSAELHGNRGNVLFGDAHVDDLDGHAFRAAFMSSNAADMVVLSLPQSDVPTDGTGAAAPASVASGAVSSPQGLVPNSEGATNTSANSTGNSDSTASPESRPSQSRGPARQLAPGENVIVIARLDGTFATSSVTRAASNGVAESRDLRPPVEPGNPLLEFVKWLAHQSVRGTYWLLLALLLALIAFELVRRRARRKAGKNRP